MIFRKKTKYYDSIDNLPVWNYWMVSEHDDFKYLTISDDYSSKIKYSKRRAFKVWDKITSEYLDYFGINTTYKDILMLNREIILNEYIWESRKEPIARVYAREAKKQLDSLEKDLINTKPQNQVFYIEKEMGFKIDPKTISIKDFYTYISNINSYAKEVKRQNNGKKA